MHVRFAWINLRIVSLLDVLTCSAKVASHVCLTNVKERIYLVLSAAVGCLRMTYSLPKEDRLSWIR